MLKIISTRQANDITGYTPYGARANDEYDEYQKFFSAKGLPVTAYLFIVAKDNGSMIRPEYLEEAVEVLNLAQNNVTLHDHQSGRNESFNMFCNSFCQTNEPVRQFYNGYKILSEPHNEESRLKLEYPSSMILGRKFSLQLNFYGVELFQDENSDKISKLLGGPDNESSDNSTSVGFVKDSLQKVTNIKSVKMITFHFRAEHKPGWKDEEVKNWEMKLVDVFQEKYTNKSKRLKIYAYSQSYVEEEMVRGGTTMLPYLTVGFSIMCLCSCVSVMVRALYMHQLNFYKIVLAVFACVTPLLGCANALALMFVCGIRFASILSIVFFLVLSIGIDSSYLMIHEWQRVTKHMREVPNRKDSVGFRMSEVLGEVGPAILISCLTNMFADAVGSFTSSYEITLLCTANMLSMWFAFIYQMTFYSALMTIVGRYEFSEEYVDKNKMEIKVAENKVSIARHHRPLTRQPSKFHETTKPIISKFMQRYVNVITTPIVFILIFLAYLLYLAFSIYGITIMNVNLTAQKLFALDSPLLELDKLRVDHQVPYFSVATVFVVKPGNLSDPQRLNRLNQMVSDFEHLKSPDWGESWGPVGTKYFIRDFETFQQSYGEEDDADFFGPDEDSEATTPKLGPTTTFHYNDDDLQYFLKWPEFDYWQGFVKLKSGDGNNTHEKQLDRFFFTAGFHGSDLSVWTNRGKMLHSWRGVVDKYPEFKPSVYHEDGVFLDLIDNMATDTAQSVFGTLACMALVCFIFLNNLFTVAIASLSVLSICAGILGILSLAGTDLDPIVMAAMIISVGFSVDIPAHVSYHYYQASIQEGPLSTPSDRLANCLSSVAFPAVQAALSTMLCVSSLLFVNLYMAEVFVKTMVLCVVLCNLHGLVFLPAILILLDSIRWACRPKGAAAQRPRPNAASKPSSGERRKQRVSAKIQPEKSSVTDRPEV
ncbi:hypothetical protein WR25_25042 [Diploscapter pachys]|uniref:SSD domain-containing protein n=1 Tax=Diploscapter pachys TaxID=2018661 RepID=A0A2A2K6R6_9BILA|nr:hypothetical protein WR25_25042 [Diploscapter pachys]